MKEVDSFAALILSAGIAISSVAVASAVILRLAVSVPLRALARAAEGAVGDKPDDSLPAALDKAGEGWDVGGDVGRLVHVLVNLACERNVLSRKAIAIAEDHLTDPVLDEDVGGDLGQYFKKMVGFLRDIKERVRLLTAGQKVAPLDSAGTLGSAFNSMLARIGHEQKEQRKLRALVESSKEVVAITRGDGVIGYLNSSGKNIQGETAASTFSDLFDESSKEVFSAALKALSDWGKWEGEFVSNQRTRNGCGIPYAVRAFKIHEDELNGANVGIAWIAKEVSDEKLAAEVAERQLRFIQLSRMSTLGQVAGAIAHEINNPLAVLMARSEIMLEDLERGVDEAKTRESITHMQLTIHRISDIVRGMRSFVRGGDEEAPKETLLQEIVNDTAVFCSARIRETGTELSLDFPRDLKIYCRSVQISQVLLNLINNALDAIQEQSEKWIQISARQRTSEEVEITVTDSGPVIPAEVRMRLLQPFFTTKAPGKGTGIGLSICRSILESQGGSIHLSLDSSRTQFVLRLPGTVVCAKAAA
ncbi:MAG: hypothetical protein A2X94_12010 [Bdellovibrionales bacterium GWB1_55_8]|nr:MAG: hypothetical protein A2X94_12010 [Bdellovibrionales bacterium GWB1_55_8]